MNEIFLVAVEFPSGTTWLINFFLEVGVMVNLEGRGNNTWNFDVARNSFVFNEEKEGWRRHLPILSAKKEFTFRNDAVVRFSHEYPNVENIDKKIILVVRDGRDAIYSQYKRFSSSWKDFPEMLGDLTTPIYLRPYTFLPRASYPETWALYNYLWQHSVEKKNLLIIKFEDLKTDPSTEVKKALDFIGVKRTDEEIQRGIVGSSFDNAKKAEEEYKKNDPLKKYATVNRKGKPNEWKEIYTSSELKWFNGFPNIVLGQFGYEPISAIRVDNSLSIKDVNVLDIKDFKIGLKKAGNNISEILVEGKKILCLYWMMAICDERRMEELNRALPVFGALLRASNLISKTPYFQMEIGIALARFGARRQSLLVIENIKEYPETVPYLMERGRASSLNFRILRARKDLLRAGHKDWLRVALLEKLDIKGKKQYLKGLVSHMPKFIQRSFYRSLRKIRQIYNM